MTIDKLLADVSPLLPVKRDVNQSTSQVLVSSVNGVPAGTTVADWQKLSDYAMHAANHFPAMLAALREALNDVKSFNLMARHTFKVHPFTRLESQLEQAIAAASEVGG